MTAPRRRPARKPQIPRELLKFVLDAIARDCSLPHSTTDFVIRVSKAAWSGALIDEALFPRVAGGFLSELGSGEDDQGLLPRLYLIGVLNGILGAIGNKTLAQKWMAERKKEQSDFAHHRRGPWKAKRKRRNEQILEWNAELLTYESGKRRERYERVRIIHDRCQKRYRDLVAEAHSFKFKEGEASAKVWNITAARIDQIIPRTLRAKKTS